MVMSVWIPPDYLAFLDDIRQCSQECSNILITAVDTIHFTTQHGVERLPSLMCNAERGTG